MKGLGNYLLFLGKMFVNRERFSVYLKRFFEESVDIGVNSLFFVGMVALFIGAVSAVQTAYNLVNPIYPLFLIGLVVRDMSILEIAPTLTAVIFAGKVGSNIASQLGNMRISEQIDAIDVMGINAISYLVLPKVLAAIVVFPCLVILAGFLAIYGGYAAGTLGGLVTPSDYIYGIRFDFAPFSVVVALVKAFIFGFLVVSISAYKGFYVRGGALEVGRASTFAVTNSCIAIFLADYLLAELLTN